MYVIRFIYASISIPWLAQFQHVQSWTYVVLKKKMDIF